MSDREEDGGVAERSRRGATGAFGRLRRVGGGWTLGDVEEQEGLVDRYAERNPGTVDWSDAAITRQMLKMVRRSIERCGGP